VPPQKIQKTAAKWLISLKTGVKRRRELSNSGGQRGAAVMSLIQSARLNGHDPYVYLRDVLTRLPTQRNSLIAELLPHRWQPRA